MHNSNDSNVLVFIDKTKPTTNAIFEQKSIYGTNIAGITTKLDNI